MLGRIDQLWDNKTDKGQPYQVLAIGDDRYSFWDKKQFGKFRKGDTVEFDWKKAGEYKNITTIELTEADNNDYNGSNGKDQRIVKMSCLKSASTIFSGLDVEPRKKVQLTIAAARRFEKYINDGSPGELSRDPATQDRPYQDLEDDLDYRLSGTGRSKKPRP